MTPTGHEHLDRVLGDALKSWPEHEKFLTASLADYDDADLAQLNDLARRVSLLMRDEAESYFSSYRWMCAEINKETFYFKKHGRYRLATFEEANREVYSNAPFMKKYVEGILASQVLWRNHSAAFLFFQRDFLARLKADYRYLEVGPGHGLFLSTAAEDPSAKSVTAWDVSEESLRQTRAALATMGVRDRVELDRQDIHAPTRRPEDGALFDGIALCEVLEHLEHPKDALASLREFLAPDGLLYINVPLNSPAPDHIFLLRDEAEVRALMQSAGLEVIELKLVPMTGYDLPTAQRQGLTVTCFVLARRA
ncbi:MAG: class I SAM-dependent methyltransferase [Phenylobacterium sp.]|nr:class I SAM-dependent methyltransferase [Phenylobacterium sp.]